MHKMRYPNIAQAVGAFVAGEMEACMAEPLRLMVDGESPVWCNPEMRKFDMHQFEKHLDGLLSDLVELCFTRSTGTIGQGEQYKGEVVLVIATSEEVERGEPREWQECAQGNACLEVYEPAKVEYKFFAADGTTIVVSSAGTDSAIEEMIAVGAPWYEVSSGEYVVHVSPKGHGWQCQCDVETAVHASIEDAFEDAIDMVEQYLDTEGLREAAAR